MRGTIPTNTTPFNRSWKLLSNPSSRLPYMGMSQCQTRRLRPHSPTIHLTLTITPSRSATLTRYIPIRTGPLVYEVERETKIRTSLPVVDAVRKASHHPSSYRIQSQSSLQPGSESALGAENGPRGQKLAPSLQPPLERARGHRRYASRIPLPSTIR